MHVSMLSLEYLKIKSVKYSIIEVNSLPGMTPATCIFHQAAINHYKPYEFIDKLIDFGFNRNNCVKRIQNYKNETVL